MANGEIEFPRSVRFVAVVGDLRSKCFFSLDLSSLGFPLSECRERRPGRLG